MLLGIGRLLAALVASRVPAWQATRPGPWPPALGHLLRARLPFWSVLTGLWLASGYWPLTPEGRVLVARALFAAGAFCAYHAPATNDGVARTFCELCRTYHRRPNRHRPY